MEISNEIRAKPGWVTKYKNPEIVAKWKKEVGEKSEFMDEIFDFVIRELQWFENVENSWPEFSANNFKIGPDDKIVYSDSAVEKATASQFYKDAGIFEKSLTAKDFHPGSNDQVVDLVHPSLYHLVYGRTKILQDGKLVTSEYDNQITKVKADVADFGISQKFQWIPSVMTFNKETRRFEFSSYINNIHPKFNELYHSIGSVFNNIVPGLNFSLARYLSEEYIRIPIPGFTDAYNEDFEEYQERLYAIYDEDGGYDVEQEEELEAQRVNYLRKFVPKYEADPETVDFDLRSFGSAKVIVKMANIELTPENPKYPGGSWHVEGTINEDIVATVLYYYDMENVVGSKLSFKFAYSDPNYEQSDTVYCEKIFGLNDGDKMSRYLGSLEAQKDRVIIFPNCFQHHVDEFELEDKTKPGFRKILCFFVVDPHNPHIKATDVVPFQQEGWPLENQFPGVEDVTTMTLAEAQNFRQELMSERSTKNDNDDDFDNPYLRNFSLCEH